MSSENWEKLLDGLGGKIMDQAKGLVGEDKWVLLNEDGQRQMANITALMAEAELMQAAGWDVTNAKRALTAAIGNLKMCILIDAASERDAFLEVLKDGLVQAGEIVFKMAGAGLRGLVLGL